MGLHRTSCLLALGASALAAAPEATPAVRAEASATVTVTAEASPVELNRTPNPVKVMNLEAIQASGARTLDELLPALLPGQILSYGGAGSASNLYLGAGRARDVVVTLDGIRITDPSGVSPSFSDFSLEGIDRVEILEGPASTRYGSDTHGGVVALYSAGPAKAGLSGEARLGAGNRALRQGGVAPAYAWDGGWVRAGVSASQEEASIPADSLFRSVATALNFGQKVNEGGLVTFTFRDHYRGTPLPFTGGYDPVTYAYMRIFDPARRDTLRDRNFIGAYRQMLGSDWLLEASLGHVANDRVEPGYDEGDPDMSYRGKRSQGIASVTWTPSKAWRTNLLVDLMQESAELGLRFDPGHDRSTANHAATALEMSWEDGSGLRAVASGRYQKDTLDYTFASGAILPERNSSRLVYKVGMNWLSEDGLRFYASYGTSYNTPDLFDLNHNLANGYGNLEDETSRGAQVGVSLERGPWLLKVEASRTRYDQVINYVNLGYPNYRYENGTNLRVQGLEATAAYAAGGLRLEAYLRSQEARNMSKPVLEQLTTSGATGRPFFTAGLRASATLGLWRLAGRWSYTGSSYMYFDDPGGVEGLRTHFNDASLALTWSPAPHLALSLRGEHLFQRAWTREEWLAGRALRQNDTYQIPAFPAPGPTLLFDVKVRF